ncbi:MAG: hypothetical protein ACI8P0_001438 [Planctomycetaceae bacterium]|jgi:hypothetical protein
MVLVTGLPAGSPVSDAFRKMVKQLLCRTLYRGRVTEKRDDSSVCGVAALKFVPEFVAVSARFRHAVFMLDEARSRGTLSRLPMVAFGIRENHRRRSR